MRVLHAPVNIANQAWGMAVGLRGRGHDVQVWQVGDDTYDFSADRHVPVPRDVRSALALVTEALDERFDVVHLHFARSLVSLAAGLPWFWDLQVWHASGARVVMTFHGSDVRLRSHHLATDEWSFYRYGDMPCDEDLVAERLEVLLAYADATTVGSVLDLPYVPGAVVVPRVVDAAAVAATPVTTRAPGPPVVLHAPSRRATKGTDLVLAGLAEVRARGVDLELDLVEGASHAETMARMARADVVVEKLLGGDVGVTSLEAMALGKVAVARIRPEVLAQSPELPVVAADPSTFADVMTDLLRSPERFADLGRRGREHVARVHAPDAVAARLEEVYTRPGRRRVVVPPGWTGPGLTGQLHEARGRIAELEAENRRLRRQAAAVAPARVARALLRRGRAWRLRRDEGDEPAT